MSCLFGSESPPSITFTSTNPPGPWLLALALLASVRIQAFPSPEQPEKSAWSLLRYVTVKEVTLNTFGVVFVLPTSAECQSPVREAFDNEFNITCTLN